MAWIKAGLKFKQNVGQNCTMLAKGPAINALRLWGRRNLTPFPAFFLTALPPRDLQEIQGDVLSFLEVIWQPQGVR